MPQPKPGREEFALKFSSILCQLRFKTWAQYRKDPNVRKVIEVARAQLGYSQLTSNQDIFLALHGCARKKIKK